MNGEKKLLFSAEGIQKHYAATHALKGVELQVNEGEIVDSWGKTARENPPFLKSLSARKIRRRGA